MFSDDLLTYYIWFLSRKVTESFDWLIHHAKSRKFTPCCRAADNFIIIPFVLQRQRKFGAELSAILERRQNGCNFSVTAVSSPISLIKTRSQGLESSQFVFEWLHFHCFIPAVYLLNSRSTAGVAVSVTSWNCSVSPRNFREKWINAYFVGFSCGIRAAQSSHGGSMLYSFFSGAHPASYNLAWIHIFVPSILWIERLVILLISIGTYSLEGSVQCLRNLRGLTILITPIGYLFNSKSN